MFKFRSSPSKKCGLIIDIGSGSIGAVILISDPDKVKAEIVWTHREYLLIKDINNIDVPLKEITTSLINIFLQIGKGGLQMLYEKDSSLSISDIQVTVSAPWTYTVTKTIHFSDEHPFLVDKILLTELTKSAEQQTFEVTIEHEDIQKKDLTIIDNQTIQTTVNGYVITELKNVKTREVSIAHLTAITQKAIVTVLEDSINKVVPTAEIVTHSFMYMYYNILKKIHPSTMEACLIHVTSEATELGIIREGTLTYVTHVSFGTFSIAREIAALCKVSNEEAYAYQKGSKSFLESKMTAPKKKELEIILRSYEKRIAELFKHTGDILSIPKTIFLHTELETESFFVKHITEAATLATTAVHNVHPITSLLFKDTKQKDTSILLSVHNFHQTHNK